MPNIALSAPEGIGTHDQVEGLNLFYESSNLSGFGAFFMDAIRLWRSAPTRVPMG